MRDMKAQQLGRIPKPVGKPGGRSKAPDREAPPSLEDEEASDAGFDAGSLVDQGDGVRVRRGTRRVADEEREHDLPDEPPPGWLEGS